MAGYVDVYALPVPKKNLGAYRSIAKTAGKVVNRPQPELEHAPRVQRRLAQALPAPQIRAGKGGAIAVGNGPK